MHNSKTFADVVTRKHAKSFKCDRGPICHVAKLLTFCLLLLPLWESVIVLCFVARCFMSVLVLQSS